MGHGSATIIRTASLLAVLAGHHDEPDVKQFDEILQVSKTSTTRNPIQCQVGFRKQYFHEMEPEFTHRFW